MSGLIGDVSSVVGGVTSAASSAVSAFTGTVGSIKSFFAGGASNAGAGSTSNAVTPDGTLTIFVQPGGQPNAAWTAYTGWTRTRVTTGIETVPGDFELEATEAYPTSPDQVEMQAGDACVIFIGGQVVLSGFVDRVSRALTSESHTVRVEGRSKCCDLVDCSAEFSTFQINNASALSLATKLCAPFGITVSTLGTIAAVQIPQFDVILTETPFEIIERVARYSTLLSYDDANGNLVLATVGATSMASGFSQGVNVQECYGTFTMDERFSYIEAVLLSTDTLFTQPGDPTDATALGQDAVQGAIATDLGVPRHRPLIIVAEQGDLEFQVAQQRCQWEVARRTGRSQQVRVIGDSWFDSSGALWAKNSLAPLELPALKVTNATWLIASVTFLRDEDGTRVDVTMMPATAFQPEPIILQPYASAVYQAVNQNGGAASANPGAAQ
jgi:prophage tail gpP-like protein